MNTNYGSKEGVKHDVDRWDSNTAISRLSFSARRLSPMFLMAATLKLAQDWQQMSDYRERGAFNSYFAGRQPHS